MSERNPTVPFGTFYHPPVQLADVMREKNCLSSTTYAVMNGLFSLVDFNQTDRIGNHDVFTGWTCVVSYGGLGERCGLSGRRTQDALKKLESESVGLIIREKVGKCNRYRITIYDQALNYLKANPGIPMKQMSQPVGSDKHQKNVKKIQDGASRIVDDGASESLRTERPSHYGRSVPHSRVLQEEYQETPVSDYPGANEETENRGDSLIEEKQEAIDLTPVSEVEEEAEEEKASLGEETVSPRGDTRNDIVPSKQIGEVLDSLTQAKGMDASPTDDSVEAIITAFNPQSPAISNWKHAQVASVLKGHLEGVLSRRLDRYAADSLFQVLPPRDG